MGWSIGLFLAGLKACPLSASGAFVTLSDEVAEQALDLGMCARDPFSVQLSSLAEIQIEIKAACSNLVA
jgi:hypothetical protein